ncbi:hypothetical protein EDB89DRAFT_1906598 [Lactarius sanguifluus]|nr:hypothetical protein EDB89DRAFT_1907237 [Lactarius sanguifluus]KAH9171783.1 hypothetical protein EDB89DRAFT_1906598 [Lactarius sanguifluus]
MALSLALSTVEGAAGDVLPAPSTSVAAATSAPAVAAWPGDSASASGSIDVNAVWDIELGLNFPSPEPAPVREDAPSRRLHEEQESLLWDICQVVTGWWREG